MEVNRKQEIFLRWVLGTLLYVVVLGFFNDYTELISITSFSTVALASAVLQALTNMTLSLKSAVGTKLKRRGTHIIIIGLAIWAISFTAKFGFLAVIDIVFGPNVEIASFAGLILLIASMLLLAGFIQLVYSKLGGSKGQTLEIT